MAFRLPTFNVAVNIWHFGNPTTSPADVSCMGNLAWGRRVFAGDLAQDPIGPSLPFMTLLVPTGTDIRSDVDTDGSPDTVEVPAFSGRYYLCHYADYIGCGFANEHIGAVIVRIPGGGPIPPDGYILDETAGFVLDETGVAIALE